jgi:hypothetical protein
MLNSHDWPWTEMENIATLLSNLKYTKYTCMCTCLLFPGGLIIKLWPWTLVIAAAILQDHSVLWRRWIHQQIGPKEDTYEVSQTTIQNEPPQEHPGMAYDERRWRPTSDARPHHADVCSPPLLVFRCGEWRHTISGPIHSASFVMQVG